MPAHHATATARARPGSEAPVDPWLRMRLAPARAARPGFGGATVRDALRAIASVRPDPAMLALELAPVRALLDQARERLVQRLPAGAPSEGVAVAKARLLDGTVVGLCHLGRLLEARPAGMLPPLAVIVRGAYGQRSLPAGVSAELLFLVAAEPIRCRQGVALAQFVARALAGLGWQASGTRRTVRGCLSEKHLDPALVSDLGDARLVWGCRGLFAELRAGLAQAMPPGGALTVPGTPHGAGLVQVA